MSFFCFKCEKELEITEPQRVGRREACPGCHADLHVCRNCRHYDSKAYNECREPQAERVLDKENSNFCDYFEFAEGKHESVAAGQTEREAALKKLDDLFK